MRKAMINVVLGLATACIALHTADAGKLDSFEQSVRNADDEDAGLKKGRRHRCDDDGDGLLDIVFDITYSAMEAGGRMSLMRIHGAEDIDCEFMPKRIGEPIIPYLRTDLLYQDVDDDVDALDFRMEIGYGPIGLHYNYARYTEESPRDALDMHRIYGLYRMSFGSRFEIDMGLGSLMIIGDSTSSRFAFTMPMRYMPGDYMALELLPAWAQNVSDYDLGLLLGANTASIKLGYRWILSPSESLNGPYLGISLSF